MFSLLARAGEAGRSQSRRVERNQHRPTECAQFRGASLLFIFRHDECVTLDGPSTRCDGSIEEAGGCRA
jgi:hypothetical protein